MIVTEKIIHTTRWIVSRSNIFPKNNGSTKDFIMRRRWKEFVVWEIDEERHVSREPSRVELAIYGCYVMEEGETTSTRLWVGEWGWSTSCVAVSMEEPLWD